MRFGIILISALTLCACTAEDHNSDHGQNKAADVASQAMPTRPLKEYMGHIVQRNAEQLWHWTEEISDANGSRSLAPQSEMDWLNAESDAMTMVDIATAIDSPVYKIDDKWPAFSMRLLQVTTDAAQAAEAKNFAKFSAASAAMNDACVACHLHYVPELEGVSR